MVKRVLIPKTVLGAPYYFSKTEVQDSFAARMDAFVEETVYSSSCGGIHEQAFRLNFDDAAEFFCAEAVKVSLLVESDNVYPAKLSMPCL